MPVTPSCGSVHGPVISSKPTRRRGIADLPNGDGVIQRQAGCRQRIRPLHETNKEFDAGLGVRLVSNRSQHEISPWLRRVGVPGHRTPHPCSDLSRARFRFRCSLRALSPMRCQLRETFSTCANSTSVMAARAMRSAERSRSVRTFMRYPNQSAPTRRDEYPRNLHATGNAGARGKSSFVDFLHA